MKTERHTKEGLEAAVTELSLAISQLRRRIRSETGPQPKALQPLNLSQLGTLVRLEAKVWATTAELARAESMKPQSMSVILKNLEDAGLIQRRDHPTDGRQIQFALTKAGLELRRQRTQAKRGWLAEAMAKLTPDEQNQLVAAIPLIKRLSDD